MSQLGEALELIGGVKQIAANLSEAREEYPTAFAFDALASALLATLIKRAIAVGPPKGLADDLGVTEEQAQKIRAFVLKRELARAEGQ